MRLLVLLALALVASQPQPQPRRHSTAEERDKVVEIARSLETDPLNKDAEEQRNWIIMWSGRVSDIRLKYCAGLLGPLRQSPLGPMYQSNHYSRAIVLQMIPSAAAFVILNPQKAKDDTAVYTAAVEGSLRAYQSILKMNPKETRPFLDDLIQKRERGELGDYIRQAAKQNLCP